MAGFTVRSQLPLIIIMLASVHVGRLPGQAFTVLHTFSGSDGANPYAGLVLSGNTLYGTTANGGNSGSGTVFAINTDGTGFKNLYSFTGGWDGAVPLARLVLLGTTLYGTTSGGGSSSNGSVFAINTDGSGFTNLYSFSALSGSSSTNSDGANPAEGLVLAGNTLYGITSVGGGSGSGTIFGIHTDGTGFSNMYNFTAMSGLYYNSDGANPNGLILSTNTLYGTAKGGGALGGGTVFAINTDGSEFTNLHSFPRVDIFGPFQVNSDGSFPKGVALSGNTLYGTTWLGGGNYGALFCVKTDSSGFTNLHNFTPLGPSWVPDDGAYPSGGLVVSDGVIYGTASGWYPPQDGAPIATTNHTVFKASTDGTGFATLHDFAKPSGYPFFNGDGIHVEGDLVLAGNILYGTAFEGGTLGKGTLFSLSLPLDFGYIIDNSAIMITNYTGYKASVVIPAIIDGLPVVRIGDGAFAGLSSLTSITIPNSVGEIGQRAFFECKGLTSITIPNGVTYIGDSAFKGCSGLTNLSMANSLTNLADSAFESCSSLATITIPNSITRIGSFVFRSCVELTNVTVPASVADFGPGVFADCDRLTAITVDPLNPSYTSVGGVLFSKDQTTLVEYPGGGAPEYSIPSTVTKIGGAAFGWCATLTNVTIPNSATNIGDSAFRSCSGLSHIIIPQGVTQIGSSTFESCSSLASVALPDNLLSIGDSAFKLCSSLTSITIPSSVTKIGAFAFQNCAITNITIPDSVTVIGVSAFYESALITASVGNGLGGIGDGWFEYCSGLTSIKIPDNAVTIGSWAFGGCSSLTSIVIPPSMRIIGGFAFAYCTSLSGAYLLGDAPGFAGDETMFFGDTTWVYYLPGTSGWDYWFPSFGGAPRKLWVPEVRISDSGFGVSTNSFGLDVVWAPGMSVVVEASTNMADPVWVPLTTNILNKGSGHFSDPQWTNYARRFYRAMWGSE